MPFSQLYFTDFAKIGSGVGVAADLVTPDFLRRPNPASPKTIRIIAPIIAEFLPIVPSDYSKTQPKIEATGYCVAENKRLTHLILSLHNHIKPMSELNNQKGFIPALAILIILVIGVIIGTFLIQQRTNVAPKASGFSQEIIYDDALRNNWKNWSWLSQISFDSKNRPKEGKKHINWKPTKPWAGFYLHKDSGVRLSEFQILSLSIRTKIDPKTVTIELYDAASKAIGVKKDLINYAQVGTNQKYQTFEIPLVQLAARNVTISGFALQDATGKPKKDFDIDEIILKSTNPRTGNVTTDESKPSPKSSQIPAQPQTSATPIPNNPTTSNKFKTLPVGTNLPTGSECASLVRSRHPNTHEHRPNNSTANQTNLYLRGVRYSGNRDLGTYQTLITGNFTGTTEEILEWGACKWGFDEDTVKAQAVKESWWRQETKGDCYQNDPAKVQTGTKPCVSVGIMQVKGADIPPTHPGTWPHALDSTAFNVDYTLALRRSCFEGKITWLDDPLVVPQNGATYAAGDEWGCMGLWYSGRWMNQGARDYLYKTGDSVQYHYNNKTWTKPEFGNY